MRRSSEHESSLDLLLDTICNMFGMVIFIAVLAAVLAAARGERTIDAMEARTPERSLEAARLRLAIESIEQDADMTLRTARERTRGEMERMLSIKLELGGLIDRFRDNLRASDSEGELEARQARIRSLTRQVQDAKDKQTIPLRTPRRHAIEHRIPVQVYLTNDRLYLVNDWSDWKLTPNPIGDRCRFWSTWNVQAVDPDASTFEDHGTCEFRTGGRRIDRSLQLRPDGGLPMETDNDLRAIGTLLDQLEPRSQFISFRVTPDSFEKFHAARRLVVERGFEHNVEPILASPTLRYNDAIRHGTSIAQ
ncbi:MAG: hypothetical protein QF561_04550 [Phycisphaerales bacterium]|jgi:hypothetical protein|nr:hypothetical protein [Phycisphaerales bacterium]